MITRKKKLFVERLSPIKMKQRTQFGCTHARASIDCIPLFHCCHRVRLRVCCRSRYSISISSKILIGSAQLFIIVISLLFYAPSAQLSASGVLLRLNVNVSHSCKWLGKRKRKQASEKEPSRAGKMQNTKSDSTLTSHTLTHTEMMKSTYHKVI